ncbi:toll/interleukin-1 receptor domain-containing protein [Faecalicoccus pleomorphus]|uniref:toll/interleukin-1 receptor domain-containing protein n=1 Tax=Faecalicoccus pleomorphus TaxID=1323 RepID=UPI0025A384A7|nr:toll/interleukin-1 receptor domain-containing protein [Faecalicoccus pleomorphus]MDM8293465.1 toll/interleukin-1 receptor domain-containing protein [Faecalicoccus pleomorphus]
MNHPTVFISYSQEDEEHKEWVRKLATRLLSDGIQAIVDQYDLELGDRLPQFMEESISNVDYVLVICTPIYKTKSDARKGGVGYEGHIISSELLTKGNERKFIPIIRKGDIASSLPNCLASKLGLLLTNENEYEINYMKLVATIYGENKKPKLGSKPSFVENSYSKQADDISPIHIIGIIADEVTAPKMDGTKGSSLYKIPFKLSKKPSRIWIRFFLDAWQSPPRFTTMHRFGIASIIEDKIVLNGTTIEEVRDYHRETLQLCIEVANKKEAQYNKMIAKNRKLEEKKRKRHNQNVKDIAEKMGF